MTTSNRPVDFSKLLGNEEVKTQLQCMLAKKAIHHALLFCGPEGIGKSLFAWALAAQVLCLEDGILDGQDYQNEHLRKMALGMHPDVHVYRPEGKLGLHSIQTVRQLTEEIYLPPYESKWKVFIVHDADRMLPASSNALLKTFEEPPANTLIILLTHEQSSLLPTIVSRCRPVFFSSISALLIEDEIRGRYPAKADLALWIARQAEGSMGKAMRMAQSGLDHLRHEVFSLLIAKPLSNYKALQSAVQKMVKEIEESKKHIIDMTKKDYQQLPKEHLSAIQQDSLEKELEGHVSVVMQQEALTVFKYILSWYRDVHLLLSRGDRKFLMNPDFEQQIEQFSQAYAVHPFETVHRFIEEAEIALQRSTSLGICLETLFLKLI